MAFPLSDQEHVAIRRRIEEQPELIVALKHPASNVENVYRLADLLTDTQRLLEGTYGHPGLYRDLTSERADALEAIMAREPFDFLHAAKAVREFADAWQAELDASPA